MNTIDGRTLFLQGYNCAEATLADVSQSMDCVSLASGFAGGVGGTKGICGALSGSVMGMGQQLGIRSPEPKASSAQLKQAVAQFLKEFGEIHGSTQCGILVPLEGFASEAEAQAFFASPERRQQCALYVEEAVRLAQSLLADIQR